MLSVLVDIGVASLLGFLDMHAEKNELEYKTKSTIMKIISMMVPLILYGFPMKLIYRKYELK